MSSNSSQQGSRWPVHYDTIPHSDCPSPLHCDCDCHACVHVRRGQVVNQENRVAFVKRHGLPPRYLCAKDRMIWPEYYESEE